MSSSRRTFLLRGTGALVAIAGIPRLPLRYPRPDFDLIVRGGTLFDGTGAPGRVADLGIKGDRIAAIAERIAARATDEVDARGMAVGPGFVDIHSHGDSSMRADPRMESVLRQGVTTIVAGQDGSSGGLGNADGGTPDASSGFAALFTSVAALRPAVNVASMVGLGTVRHRVIGLDDRPATPEEMRRMVMLVEAAIREGACGASSGLEYTPGAFATRDELVTLCRPLARRQLLYATHMRNEDDQLLESIDESLAVATDAGCPLQISHLKTQGPRNWSKLDEVFHRIESAQARGADVAFDRYPYLAYATGLTNLFPLWSRDGGTNAFLQRLSDPAVTPRIRNETLAKVALIGGWENVQISAVRVGTDRSAEGARLETYARSLGTDPYELAVALLRRNEGNVGMVGFAMSEDNLDRILSHPRGMIASDGGAFALDGPTHRGSPHPRGAGTFPLVLADHVRARGILTLEQAIYKMTGFPATRLQLRDRGRLVVGFAADVVVFDPATIQDRATFANPFQYPEGISVVVVGGTMALREGQRVGVATGRPLRPV